MKRRNGTRYDRKRAHQVRDNIIYSSYRDWGWDSHKRPRLQVRQQLHHTSLDDDWDVFADDPRISRWWSAPSVRHRKHWRDNDLIDPRFKNITTEEIKHLPQWAQHRWHQNLGKENDHYSFNYLPRIRRSYDHSKVLQALKAACHDPEKIWTLERPRIKRKNHLGWLRYEYDTRISIPLSDLEDWLHIQLGYSHKRYDLDGEYLYTIPYTEIKGLGDFICKTLLDLGYNIYRD